MDTSISKLKEKIKAILNSNNIGAKIENEEDSNFLFDFFSKYHPQWKEKLGESGFSHFEVGNYDKVSNSYYTQTRCFFVVRNDGTREHISYTKCKKSHSSDYRKIINATLRNIIAPKIIQLRDSIKVFPYHSPLGDWIYRKQDLHIDHYDYTFKEVVDMWIKSISRTEKEIVDCIDCSGSNTETFCFKDGALRSNWEDFHDKNTHLRAISKKENLKRKKE